MIVVASLLRTERNSPKQAYCNTYKPTGLGQAGYALTAKSRQLRPMRCWPVGAPPLQPALPTARRQRPLMLLGRRCLLHLRAPQSGDPGSAKAGLATAASSQHNNDCNPHTTRERDSRLKTSSANRRQRATGNTAVAERATSLISNANALASIGKAAKIPHAAWWTSRSASASLGTNAAACGAFASVGRWRTALQAASRCPDSLAVTLRGKRATLWLCSSWPVFSARTETARKQA